MGMTSLSLRRAGVLAVVAAAGAGLVACGSSNQSTASSSKTATPTKTASSGSSTTSSGSGSSLSIAASEKGGLSFTKKALTTKAGTVTITMANPSGDNLPHAVAIEGNGVDKAGAIAQPGGTSTVAVKLKPGKYAFYCPVDGHRKAGMEGTLTVQ